MTTVVSNAASAFAASKGTGQETAHLGVALRVLQQVQQEHRRLLRPPRLAVGRVLVLGLRRTRQGGRELGDKLGTADC